VSPWQPSSAAFTFHQDADDMADARGLQSLTVRVEDAGAGKYVVVETPRWALDLDQIDALAALLRRCAAACGEE
jgi:hypothetical protein